MSAYEYVLQVKYGNFWEEELVESTLEEIQAQLKLYQNKYPTNILRRKVFSKQNKFDDQTYLGKR